jgi:enhancing lycopene biosynthesis protein 2
MIRVAVILSGCGVFDGSEIHESVLTLLALDRANADISIFAPNISQHHVINHLTGEETKESRNVLVEAARIARGKIADLSTLDIGDFDALVFPGGFGAAKNLSDFAFKGASCQVHPSVSRVVSAALKIRMPMAFICIAPVILTQVAVSLELSPTVTIGSDDQTAQQIERIGGRHQNCPPSDYVLDGELKVVTTPAYMLGQRISEVAEGIDRAVSALLELC